MVFLLWLKLSQVTQLVCNGIKKIEPTLIQKPENLIFFFLSETVVTYNLGCLTQCLSASILKCFDCRSEPSKQNLYVLKV